MQKAPRFVQLYFPFLRRCHICQGAKIASLMQILSIQHRYYCCDCATTKGFPPSKDLLNKINQIDQLEPTRTKKSSRSKVQQR
jgi:hypothetical protein